MFKTRFTEKFGVKYPIMQGALGYKSKAELVSAVSNAGGLGSLTTVGMSNVDELRDEIRKTKSLTDRPFAVNLVMLHTMLPISPEQIAEVVIDEGVPIVESIALGRIPQNILDTLKQNNVKIIHKCTLVKHALSAEQQGVDAVTILSFGADGRIGMNEISPLVQIPKAVETLKIPVIAAGAVADARGFVACLALGADAVLLGTRFYTAQECPVHPKIREYLLQSDETDVVVVGAALGIPGRRLKNKLAMQMLELEKKGASADEILKVRYGTSQKADEGDIDGASISSGQVIGLIHEILTAREIIEGIISDAKNIIDRLGSLAMNKQH